MIRNKSYENQILVIGGGVAGISAALDLADQGEFVYLVERSPSIGGKMAQLDKTFPTLDCSICILAPKMVECARHPRIKLLTYSEVQQVDPINNGSAFKVKILCKPRYIDASKCTSCGTCAKKCPYKKFPSEFDQGLIKRGAAYIPFLQAVPAVYLIDEDNCIYFKNGTCKVCEKFCPTHAVDFEQKPQEIEIEVASIINACGFDLMDVSSLSRYGYGEYSNVIISMEYERIMCASGPTKGEILRPSDNKHPHKIGFILCVGSRNIGLNPYCSKICCMYATKEAIMTMEHHPDAEIEVYYNDLRTIGKNHNEFIERAKSDYKVHYIKGLPNKIYEVPETKNLIIKHIDFESGEVKFETVDMVVLFPAVIPSRGSNKLNQILGVNMDEYGFVESTVPFNNIETNVPGIYVCGCAHGPEDISTSVAEASGAASRAVSRTSLKAIEEEKEEIFEKKVLREDPLRIGVFICHCGSNIADFVDVEKIAEEIQTIHEIIYVERNLYTCSEESQRSIQEAIKKYDLNRVIIAACTPRTHLPLFQATCAKVGLNPYLVLFASIRELVSWVHMSEPERATQKAKEQILMTVSKARLVEPLYDIEVNVLPSALVIGGGITGMTSSLAIAKKGFRVFLVERDEELGGFIRNLHSIDPDETPPEQILTPMIQAIRTNPNIEVLTSSLVNSVKGSIGDFKVSIGQDGVLKDINVGTIIVAVGGQEFKPKGFYKYEKSKNIFTNLEFENLIRSNHLKDGEKIAFIQCVGSREEEGRTYCSLTCCSESIKNALIVKKLYPNSQIFILYRDIRVSYEEEIEYRKAREKGINFIQYLANDRPYLKNKGGKLSINVKDFLTRVNFDLEVDKIVLATPLIAWEENKKLSEMLKVPVDSHGFFFEAHPKLRPVDFATDGIFICGTAQCPKNIKESISQALGAASRALIPLMNAKASVEGATSSLPEFNKKLCTGCEVCLTVCPYNAIYKNDLDEIEINQVLCKGCGVCGATCTNQALVIKHFTDEQIISQINSIIERKLIEY
ncbi:MAG: FAD-dependent oxidoreductase [Candidatus Hermodarchaeota archaeon]